ncbi:hypothetical protein GCM10007939_08660 [Amylibacter marinus]|uniref:DUF1023 domain-containing protein n=1 Tax=Amylibacter marinus TaxID=1475483 RepID=A0ABQ5VT35_9RHOB|nr:alpha/beta hydrolase [Amylibacter marinus]GLQ34583.1 hypothetical protein GCM10007939_08660 [Amylibacter marinus]
MKYDPLFHFKTQVPLRMFPINSWGRRICNPDQPARDYRTLLRHQLARTPVENPITLMVHGAGFSPFSHRANPQETLFGSRGDSTGEKWADRAWAMRFAPSTRNPRDCLAITYGWHATGDHWTAASNLMDTRTRAEQEAPFLAQLLDSLRQIDPARTVNILCHGMGAHLVLLALSRLTASTVARVVLIDAQTFDTDALLALNRPVTKGISFYNMCNDAAIHTTRWANRILPNAGKLDSLVAFGFAFKRKNWIDIRTGFEQKSQAKLGWRAGLSNRRHSVANCHWSGTLPPLANARMVRILFQAPRTEIEDLRPKGEATVPLPFRPRNNPLLRDVLYNFGPRLAS